QLVRAADSAGELMWRMPLVDEYLEALSSPIADLSHIARDRKVSGGSVTAALFLREFTHGVPWAHLDIAGPARADSDVDEISRGGTGYGVRLLLEWLCRPAYRRDS
ncbi:MAG: leucyl aminopeptidase, partial [Actinomycetes bacterium]